MKKTKSLHIIYFVLDNDKLESICSVDVLFSEFKKYSYDNYLKDIQSYLSQKHSGKFISFYKTELRKEKLHKDYFSLDSNYTYLNYIEHDKEAWFTARAFENLIAETIYFPTPDNLTTWDGLDSIVMSGWI